MWGATLRLLHFFFKPLRKRLWWWLTLIVKSRYTLKLLLSSSLGWKRGDCSILLWFNRQHEDFQFTCCQRWWLKTGMRENENVKCRVLSVCMNMRREEGAQRCEAGIGGKCKILFPRINLFPGSAKWLCVFSCTLPWHGQTCVCMCVSVFVCAGSSNTWVSWVFALVFGTEGRLIS